MNQTMIEGWLAGRGENTARAYRRAAMQFAGRLNGDLAAATPGSALDWALALSAAGKAPATVAAAMAAGWSLYEYLRAAGVYGRENPFTPVFVRRPAVRRTRVAAPAQMMQRLLAAVGGGVLGARDRALLLVVAVGETTAMAAAYTVADAERADPQVRVAVREYLRCAGRERAAGGEYVFEPLRPAAARHLHDGDVDPSRHLSPPQVAAVVRKLAGRAGVSLGARSLRGVMKR